MTPHAADSVISSFGETIKIKNRQHEKASDMDLKFPASLQQKIQSHHGTSNEILRHFWSSFIPYKAEKNKPMVEGLRGQRDKFHEILIAVVTANYYHVNVERVKQVLHPLLNAIDKAIASAETRTQK